MGNMERAGKWYVKLSKGCFDSKVDIKFYIQTLPYIKVEIETNKDLTYLPKMCQFLPLESFSWAEVFTIKS